MYNDRHGAVGCPKNSFFLLYLLSTDPSRVRAGGHLDGLLDLLLFYAVDLDELRHLLFLIG